MCISLWKILLLEQFAQEKIELKAVPDDVLDAFLVDSGGDVLFPYAFQPFLSTSILHFLEQKILHVPV